MPRIATANTASEIVRSTDIVELRAAARALELYDTGDVAGADDVFTPDVIDHTPAGEDAGIEGIRALIAAVRDGFSDVQHRILYHHQSEGGWVVMHWRMTAVHTGPAFGFAASGKSVDILGIDIMRIADGRIAEQYHVEEMLKLAQQISPES